MTWSTEITQTKRRVPATKPTWRGWQFAVKYSVDRGVALVALVVLLPLMIVIALAVRLSSPGPVLFRQRRVGRDGRSFELFKFRSMRDEPTDRSFRPADGDAPGGVEGVDRRTRVGRLLRASSLDELPQLLNVLRGEMSLIGPRPERPEFAERFAEEIPDYAERHRVKAGITGWAQANGLRGQTPIAERVKYDNYYIDHWSIQLEFMTILLTVVEVLRFREARRARPRPAQLPAPSG
jgi:lipopolysaccharide/colanic/teichoic acid biosynthesis glycosyltransferase